jgi:hypothetical protein
MEELIKVYEELKRISKRLSELGFVSIAFRVDGDAEELKQKIPIKKE